MTEPYRVESRGFHPGLGPVGPAFGGGYGVRRMGGVSWGAVVLGVPGFPPRATSERPRLRRGLRREWEWEVGSWGR